ncbi:MAG: prepilin-type N-terminal cleavage/methylation domain-containing protein [Thermoleophilia bacterium]
MKMSNRVRATRAHAGFTLVEVMVAALLLLMVLIPMLGVLISSVTAAIKSETENTAALLAQEQVEEIRARNYASMVLNAAQIDAQSGITGTAPNYTFTYEGTAYPVVADSGGTITPVSQNVQRRNAVYTIKRYVLWVDEPAGGATAHDYKKIVVVVSWTRPQLGSMTFEADASEAGTSTSRPPFVVATLPYIGDAFRAWDEIGTVTANATDPDGTPQQVKFEYKKNVDANFSLVGTDTTGVANGSGGYDFSVSWSTNIVSEAQYNLRVIATDNTGLTGQETHPFFLDPTAPLPPSGIAVTDAVGIAYAPPVATPWPLRVTWPAVQDYIDSNTNFNMVIGYLVYRDERPVGSSTEPVSSTPIAAIYGSEATLFDDATPVPANTEVRYRLKSLGRAQYWRGDGLSSLTQMASGWFPVSLPASGHRFSIFAPHPSAASGYQVFALPTSWSAVALAWSPQADDSGHRANLYLIYRNPAWDSSASRSLVGIVSDDGTLTEITYRDENLKRNTQYQYFVLPVVKSEYPDSTTVEGTSNAVTTSLY